MIAHPHHTALRIAATAAFVSAVLACGPKHPPADPDDRGEGGKGTTDGGAPIDWASSGIDWSEPPPPDREPVFAVPSPTSFELPNGLKVVVLENRRLPLVSAILVSRHGGNINDPKGKSGLAGLTADLLDEGTSTRTALEIADDLERLGADLEVGATTDYMRASMNTLASTLDQSMQLFASVIRDSAFTQDDFDRIKSDRLSSITRRRDQPRTVASLVFDRVVFGDHPYALPVLGLEADLQSITRNEAMAFYRGHYAPQHCTLIVAGDVSVAALEETLRGTFGAWKTAELRIPAPPDPPVATPSIIAVVDKPDAPQTVVHIGRLGMDRSDARYFTANVINTVIGGSFASRLNHRLREELGYTYGIRSSFWMGRESGTWSVRTSLYTESTIDGIKEILAIVDGVRTADVPADELDKSKQLRIRQLPQEFETNAGAASAFADIIAYDQPIDWYERYGDGIAAITAGHARYLAGTEWDRKNMVMIVVGDITKLRPQLEALGFASIVEYDPEGRKK